MVRIKLDRFNQARLGILEEVTLLDLGGRVNLYRHSYFEEYWAHRKDAYSADFQEFVEREILSLRAENPIRDQ